MGNSKKVILITGGSSGIGKSIGKYLVSKNFIVYGTTRNTENYPNFSDFPLINLDVTKSESITQAVALVLEKEDRIDVLINNAGVGITGALEEIPEDEIFRNFDTNYFGSIRTMKAVLPTMRKQNSGLIVNITSIAAYMGLPFRSVYSASKAALEVTTEALRMEVKKFGIQITNVAPGDFETNIASRRFHTSLENDSPYHKEYATSLDLMDNHVNDGSDPKEVAILIEKIINSEHVKIHYKVGAFMQKFSVVLKKILPDKIFEKLLLNHYKL